MTIDDRELDRRLGALTRETEADESLWPGIERRLRPARRWPAAAAAAAAVVLGVLFVALTMIEATPPDSPATARVEDVAAPDPAVGVIAVSLTDAPPSVVEAWRDNQAAIEQLEQALESDPDNPLLLEFLSEAQLRQARLIHRGLFPTERSI